MRNVLRRKSHTESSKSGGNPPISDGEIPSLPPVSSILKDELLLISFLVLFVGIISTETYYHAFGIRYQFLSIPNFHIVYRGLTAVLAYPLLIIPYALGAVWLACDGFITTTRWITLQRFQRASSYLVIIALLAIAYPLAGQAGDREAHADLYEKTSTLPLIVNLETSTGQTLTIKENYRLLMVDSDYILLFVPIQDSSSKAWPYVKRLSKGDVHVLETVRR